MLPQCLWTRPSSWTHITVGINFRGWDNFMTAKSTTKVMKISTPRKLPAIQYMRYAPRTAAPLMSNLLRFTPKIVEPNFKETPEMWTSTLRQAHNMMQDHTLHCVVHASDQKLSLQTRYFHHLQNFTQCNTKTLGQYCEPGSNQDFGPTSM